MHVRVHLTFPAPLAERLAGEPLLHRVGTDFGVVPTIRRANIEEGGGWMIVDLAGEPEAIADATAWLADRGVQVERLG